MTRRPLAVLVLALAAGCGGSTPSATVTGEVKLDGQLLKDGTIKFLPRDGKAYVEAPITEGKYTATVPQGEMRVEITANKVIGKTKMYDTPDSPTVDEVEELIPEKYNTASELGHTVTAGTQTKNFELTGGKPAKAKKPAKGK